MRKILTATIVICLSFTGTVSAVDILDVEASKYVNTPGFLGFAPDRFIVVLRKGVSVNHTQDTRSSVALSSLDGFPEAAAKNSVHRLQPQFPGADAAMTSTKRGREELARYYKVQFNSGNLEKAIADYSALPDVERVEPVGIHGMFATPNDTYFDPYQWYHNQTNDDDIDSPEAWNIQTGSSARILAILDSGTRYFHPDLGGVNASSGNPGASRGNMWINTAELNGSSGVDDDGNGYTDDWIGYDFIDGVSNCWPGEDCNNKDNDPRDFNGHGTHTAGIVGMITNDGYGMAGVAGGWNNGSQAEYGNGVKVMPLRMGYSYNYLGQEYGVVMMDAAAEAFYYAADNGATIASCSWGSSNSGGIAAAATYFTNNGGLIFVAAGNDGSQTPGYLNSRSDCISVAATDQNDGAASFTTYGTWVDISAPGVGIYSTYHDHADPNTNYWASLDGTSMACPMAAATAAMIWSQNPSWTSAQVESQLYSSAENIDAELTSQYIGKMGAGRINLFDAVNTGPVCDLAADFSGSPTSGCASLSVSFTDLSTGTAIDGWSWTFGDGGSSTAQNPNYTYSAAGTYDVSLTVSSSSQSCNDAVTKTGYITVDPGPTANYVGSPTSGTEPLLVSFTDQSTNATGWSWDFGDGGTSTAQNPNYTYNAAGTYTVTLTASNACGSDVNTKVGYITVDPCVTPTANFAGSPTSGTEPLTVSFTDQSSNTTSWSWDFGDAGTSTTQNPNHTYNAAGTYTVTLTASNACGSDVNTKVDYITVNPCITPTAGFAGSPTSGDYPLTVSFTDQSSGAGSWSWDYGDGGTSTQQSPGYTYTAAGTYTVTQTVTNACGSDQLVRTSYITVTTPPCNSPVAGFVGSPTSGNVPLTVNFTDQSSNNPTSWSWDFGDGGSSTAQNPNYTYNAAGTYTVSLSATNSCGSDQLVQTNYITVNSGPVTGEGFILSRNADFSTDDRVFNVNETLYMKVWTDQIDYNDLRKNRWELKDANKNKAREPFTNNFDNTYTASFALSGLPSNATDWTWKGDVQDNAGGQYRPTTNITVNAGPPPAPVADFSGTPTSGFAPLAVSFTDLSTNIPTSWSWDFGDGGTSTQQNPGYTFNTPGTYTVSLTATNGSGSDTNTKTNYITVNTCSVPVAGFVGSPTSGDYPLAVSFTDQSSNTPTSWNWDFGDGGNSTAQNPNHTYTAAGTYTVSLTATNSCGSDQSVRTNYITVTTPPCNPPVAGFSGSPTSGNVPLTVAFTDQTTNSPTSWSWDFGDGGTSTQQNPNYTYNAVGTYTVSLTATNSCGSDQSVQTNYITVNDGGPVTGEGFILSRNPDFSTDDRSFSRTETIYMKVWTDQVDYNDLKKSEWELRDANKNKVKQGLANHFDNTYTASFDLANLPSAATDWTWKGKVEDNSRTKYQPTANITVTGGAARVEGLTTPQSFQLMQNYPNPFNPSTEISFGLPVASDVELAVYNVVGQRVAVLVDSYLSAGQHTISWDASKQSSGIYFYRLTTDAVVETKKMLLMK